MPALNVAIIREMKVPVCVRRLWEQKEADSQHCEDSHCQLKDSFASEDKEQQTQQQLLQSKVNNARGKVLYI